jgi:hypothetical protein
MSTKRRLDFRPGHCGYLRAVPAGIGLDCWEVAMLDLLTTASSDLVHNEWAKLAATFWNNAAVAAFVGGVVTPMFSDKYRFLTKGGIFILGMLLAVVFHCIGRAFISTMH